MYNIRSYVLQEWVAVIISILLLSTCLGQQSDILETNLMCGPNCLWLAAQLHGVTSSRKELMYLAGSNLHRGTSLKGMVKALREIELHPLVFKTDWAGLHEIKAPTILLMKKQLIGHYVLLDEMYQSSLRVIDPPNVPTMTKEDFMKIFTGYAIVVCGSRHVAQKYENQFKISTKSYHAQKTSILFILIFLSILILFLSRMLYARIKTSY